MTEFIPISREALKHYLETILEVDLGDDEFWKDYE